MPQRPLRSAFSVLELLLAMSLSACMLGGLGYWMLHGGRLVEHMYALQSAQDGTRDLERALRGDFSRVCLGGASPWLELEITSEGQSVLTLRTALGTFQYAHTPQGWVRTDLGSKFSKILTSPEEVLSFKVWGRSSAHSNWESIAAPSLWVNADRATAAYPGQSYTFGWLELISTNTPQRVMHRFRSF